MSQAGMIFGGVFLYLAAHQIAWPSAPPARSSDSWQVEEIQQNTVPAVLQCREGYLWLGTYNGLVRYDGARITVFDSSNTPGLKNSRVTSLYEDPEGVLWVGHETGELTRKSGRMFQPAGLGATWPGGAIEALSSDEDHDLWLMNNNGLLFRVRDGLAIRTTSGMVASGRVTLVRARDGKLWIAADGVVSVLERGRLVPVPFDNPDGFYPRIYPSRDGGMWVAGEGRIRKWRQDRWVADMGPCPCNHVAITSMVETRSGAVLAGTLNDGLFLLAPDAEPVQFNRTNGLSHDWVRTLHEDHEGNIWVGTGGGLNALRARKVRMLDPPDAWQGRAVMSFTLSADGSAWIATEGAGLYRYHDEQWTRFAEESGLANLFVWSVLETRRKELYVGTWGGGVLRKRAEHFELPDGLQTVTAPVVALHEGRRGELWIGTTSGLHRYEGGKLTWFAGQQELKLPDVRTITESPDGTIWFGMSGGGLGSFKDGKVNQFRKQEGLNSDFVLSLYPDADGTLWIGTLDNGLCRLKQGRFSTISTGHGLSSRVISHIVDDEAGNLWLGSHHGILRASKSDLNRCADGLAKTVHFLSYGKAEGLASETCSGGFFPGARKMPSGQIWFPTPKGLAVVNPANVTANPFPPPVVIEDFLVEGQAMELGRGPSALQIPPGSQRFEVHYTGLSFAAPGKVRFKHRLAGLEEDWVDAGAARMAQYSYLPPGPYTFHVIACNNDNVWNETGASLAFVVLPHFWQTWWFRGASLGGGAALVGLTVLSVTRRRVRRKLDRLERQRALERERARIARDIHDDLGASLTRITMLSQTVRSELDGAPHAAADVDQIYSTARELTRAMDEIVWAVNPKHDTLDSLVTYLGRFAQNFLSAAGIRCRLDVPLNLPAWTLSAETRHNVFLALKEALHNVVKHAGASEVGISLELRPAGFVLAIADNGCGFLLNGRAREAAPVDGTRVSSGNGLANMRRRLEEIGGRCDWETVTGEGTRVKLAIDVKT